MDLSSCRLQAPQQGADVPYIRRTPLARDALSSLALAFTSLSENPKVAFGEGPPSPGGRIQGLSSRGLAPCPQGATWTRVCHSPVSLSRPERASRGPLQVRNPAQEIGKPSHADPPRLWEVFESLGAAIAGGSHRGCKGGFRAGVLLPCARPD